MKRATLAAACALLAVAPARPYTLWGTSLAQRTHPFYVDASLPLLCNGTVEDWVGAVILSTQEWGVSGGADFRYVFAGLVTPPYPPGASVLQFGTWCVGYPLGGIFQTCMFGGIPFDVSGSPPPGTFDLQGSSVHQMGHALGLGHTTVAGASMSTQSVNALEWRTIEPDDIAGVQAIYGPLPAGSPVLDYAGVPFTGRTIQVRVTNYSGPTVVGFDTDPGPLTLPGIGTLEIGMSASLIAVATIAPTSLPVPIPADAGLVGSTWYMHAVALNGTGFVLSNPFRLAIPY